MDGIDDEGDGRGVDVVGVMVVGWWVEVGSMLCGY